MIYATTITTSTSGHNMNDAKANAGANAKANAKANAGANAKANTNRNSSPSNNRVPRQQHDRNNRSTIMPWLTCLLCQSWYLTDRKENHEICITCTNKGYTKETIAKTNKKPQTLDSFDFGFSPIKEPDISSYDSDMSHDGCDSYDDDTIYDDWTNDTI